MQEETLWFRGEAGNILFFFVVSKNFFFFELLKEISNGVNGEETFKYTIKYNECF